jgi:hypothetical protein
MNHQEDIFFMSKNARNKPCPCGSGKKYKKCCINKEHTTPQTTTTSITSDPMNIKQIIDEMPAYLRMQIHDSGDVEKGIQSYLSNRAHWQKKIQLVAELDNEKIVEILTLSHIDASRHAFCKLADQHSSAFELSEVWRKSLNTDLGLGDEAFLRLATCKLWQHWLPDRPCVEMIDDWMQQGYTLWMDGNTIAACDLWIKTWKAILPRLTPDMQSTDDAKKAFIGTQEIHDWLQDFLLELQNVAIEELRFAEEGIQIIHNILEQFPKENELTLQNWRADLGSLYYLAGRCEEGEKIFQQLISDFPSHSHGYVRFALSLGEPIRGNSPLNLPQAIAIIEEAINKPLVDKDDYDLQSLLESLIKSK